MLTEVREKNICEDVVELFRSVESGDLARLLEVLAGGVIVDSRDLHGRTALMVAALRGHIDIYSALRSAGASLKLTDARGVSAVEYLNVVGCVPVETVSTLQASVAKAYALSVMRGDS